MVAGAFHIGDRVTYKGEHVTVKDVRLEGQLVIVEDEYGLAFQVTPEMIERLGYKATVDPQGFVTSIEDVA